MVEKELDIPILQPGEKVIGSAYLRQDGEIVFTPHWDAVAVVLVEVQPGASGPWAVRVRPRKRVYWSTAA